MKVLSEGKCHSLADTPANLQKWGKIGLLWRFASTSCGFPVRHWCNWGGHDELLDVGSVECWAILQFVLGENVVCFWLYSSLIQSLLRIFPAQSPQTWSPLPFQATWILEDVLAVLDFLGFFLLQIATKKFFGNVSHVMLCRKSNSFGYDFCWSMLLQLWDRYMQSLAQTAALLHPRAFLGSSLKTSWAFFSSGSSWQRAASSKPVDLLLLLSFAKKPRIPKTQWFGG